MHRRPAARSAAQIAALIEAHVAAHLPPGCNATVRELGFSAAPYTMGKDSLPNRVAAQVGGLGR